MALQTTGPISLDDIQTEFGGSNPISVSEYYEADIGVPELGLPVKFSDFYGTSSFSVPDLSSASYDSVILFVGVQDNTPFDGVFSPDGTKMYMTGWGTDSIHRYSLSIAWDLSSASYDSVNFDLTAQDSISMDIAFSPDGTKMYMLGYDTDHFFQYSLSTAWDLSTASYDNVSYNLGAQDNYPSASVFSPDGKKMYMLGYFDDSGYQYSLSTAWDLSTVSYDNVSFSFRTQDIVPNDIAFSPDGTKIYMLGYNTNSVYQYSLPTAWDLSIVSYDNVSYDFGAQDGSARSISFSSNGAKMYMVGYNTESIYQYSV